VIFRFGILAEGVLQHHARLPELYGQHHSVTGIRTHTGKPYLLSLNITARPKYMAGGVRTIIAVAKNKFDLRLEAYVFQPYEAIQRRSGQTNR
jgi:hypothetical protein